MKLLSTFLLGLLMAGTAHAQTAKPAEKAAKAAEKASKPLKVEKSDKIDKGEADERESNDDDALAMAALEGLMMQPPERSLPILKKVLAGSQPTVVKRRALFVLSQVNSPEAHDILMQTARINGELRGDAIRSIGISGDPRALDALQDIYKTGDEDSKKQILQAWMIAGRKEAIFNVAVNAKTEDEASEAIRMLGVMGATDELRKLGDTKSPNGKTPNGLLDALAISGDLAGLRKIAEGAGDKEQRVDATRRIGIIQSDAARTALREIYTGSTDEDMRKAALQGLLISQDDQAVLALYRAAKTSDEKRLLLRTLSMMNSDAAIEAIDATLEKKP